MTIIQVSSFHNQYWMMQSSTEMTLHVMPFTYTATTHCFTASDTERECDETLCVAQMRSVNI